MVTEHNAGERPEAVSCRTRYAGLSYRRDAPGLWRFVDDETGHAVGPHYPTRAELLADVERYAKLYGFDGPQPEHPLAYLILPADVVADLAHGAEACWALQRANVLDVADDTESARIYAQQASRRLGRPVCVMAVSVLETVGDAEPEWGPCRNGHPYRPTYAGGLSCCETCGEPDLAEPGCLGHGAEPDEREPYADDGEPSPPEADELSGLSEPERTALEYHAAAFERATRDVWD